MTTDRRSALQGATGQSRLEGRSHEALPLLRLMHLISPTLPIGAFTYSQGLEWAVEAGWVRTESALEQWLEGQMEQGIGAVDLPLLLRLQRATAEGDLAAFFAWADYLIACRETAELRAEERQRGRAMATLLPGLGIELAADWQDAATTCQAAGFALAARHWEIAPEQAALGYAWGWLENQVIAGVKLIPLGQTAGQRVLHRLTPVLAELVERAAMIEDDAIGGSLPALAIASSLHEGQYTRLFRS